MIWFFFWVAMVMVRSGGGDDAMEGEGKRGSLIKLSGRGRLFFCPTKTLSQTLSVLEKLLLRWRGQALQSKSAANKALSPPCSYWIKLCRPVNMMETELVASRYRGLAPRRGELCLEITVMDVGAWRALGSTTRKAVTSGSMQ